MTRNYKDWEKVLFRSNAILQNTELNEIQDTLLNRLSNSFNSLYSSVYSVIKGFSIKELNFDGANYQYLISEGLIRYKNEYSTYLTVPEQVVLVPNNQRNFINLKVNELIKEGNLDPTDGGELFGTKGSPILHYTVETVVNEDGWPLAIIDTINDSPIIFSFFEKKYEYDYLLTRLPQQIEDFTYKVFYEQSGNFVAKGLELKVTRTDAIPRLRVTEGVAYINGKRVEVNSTQYFQIPSSVIADDEVLYIYLDNRGTIFYRQYLLPKNSPNIFLLGSILKAGLKYIIRKTKSRALSVVDLNRLEQLNKELQATFVREALNYRSINLNYANLKDTFIEVFSDLSGSDINSFLFSASISTDKRYCSLGKSSDLIELRNSQAVVNNEDNVGLFSNYIVADHDNVILLDQNSVTEWITLTNSTTTKKGVITLTPNTSRPAIDTKQFEVLYEIEGEINPILNATRIRVEGTGFNNETNLSILFGSTVITEYDLISGATFSGNNSTFRVNNTGRFILEFNVPSNLPAQNYSVVIRNETITSGAIYRVINNSGILALESGQINLEVTDQGIAQSFTITDACILKQVGIYIRTVVNTEIKPIAGTISVVRLINDIPENQALGKATIFTEQVLTSERGTVVSLFDLDDPIYLKPGSYALIVSNYIETMELFSNTIGAPLLSTTNNVNNSTVNFIGGDLFNYSNNTWIKDTQRDLAFQLVKMSFKTSSLDIPITLLNPVNRFSLVNSFIKYIRPSGTTVEVKYKYGNINTYETLTPNLLLPDKVERLELLFQLRSSNPNIMPLIDNNSFFITNSFSNEGTWISKTVEMQDYYSQVNVELETYLPESTSITVYISSNKGQTWEELEFDKKTLSNGATPLYRETYTKDLTDTVSFFFNEISSTFRRKFLTIRVDLKSNSLNQNPYFTNIVATAI